MFFDFLDRYIVQNILDFAEPSLISILQYSQFALTCTKINIVTSIENF